MNENISQSQNWFKKIISNKMFMSSTFIMAVSFLGGILNFVFNILMARILGQDKYGIVYPLISLSMIIGLPSKALLYVMTKDFSELIHQDQKAVLIKYMRSLVKWILIFNLLLIGSLYLLLPFLKSYLHVTDNLGFLLVFAYLFMATLSAPYNSLIQSRERFFWAGIGQLLNVAVKFLIGYVLVKSTVEYFGVLWGILAGSTSVLVIFGLDALSLIRQSKDLPLAQDKWTETSDLKRILKSFLFALISIGFFQLITYIDSLLVRHLLPDQSGIYAVVNQLGKASFFIATGVSFVLLPMMSKEKGDRRKSNLRGLLFLIVFLFAYVAAITVFKDFISNVLFQGKYAGMEKILPLYTLMFIPYAAISYLVNYYFLSQKLFYSFTILIGAILQVAGIYLFHQDLVQVSIVVGATGYLVFIALLIDSFILGKRKDPADQRLETID